MVQRDTLRIGGEAERRREPVLHDPVAMKCHFLFSVSGGIKKGETDGRRDKVLQQKTKLIKTATDYLQRRAEV